GVGAAALIGVVLWRMLVPRAVLTAMFALFALSALGAIATATIHIPRMERLRAEGQGQSPAFKTLHAQASMVYVSQTLLLFVAGLLIPVAMRRDGADA